MEGLLKEADELVENKAKSPTLDAAIISAAQKVEHYEIASYGSLCELCNVLGLNQIGSILGRTLDEEKNTDETLNEIAQDVNDDALEMYENEGHGQQSEFESADR